MQLKFIFVMSAAWALLVGRGTSEDTSYCYDAEQHPVKFSDLGSRLDITQALNETCESPIGDHTYACNAAVSIYAGKTRRHWHKKTQVMPHTCNRPPPPLLVEKIINTVALTRTNTPAEHRKPSTSPCQTTPPTRSSSTSQTSTT